MNESYSGIGRKDKRWMIKRWKQSGTNLSLKQWAKLQGKLRRRTMDRRRRRGRCVAQVKGRKVTAHDWREWMSGANIYVCARCGTTAQTNFDRTVWRAALSGGPLVVGQNVPEDCEQLVLQGVHDS